MGREVREYGRYLMLWELDETKIPANPKERAAAWAPLVEGVQSIPSVTFNICPFISIDQVEELIKNLRK
jgi:hypothetical protein